MAFSHGGRRRVALYSFVAAAAAMAGFYLAGAGVPLASTGKYLPHGFCYTWQPALIALHLVSDLLIGLAYISIPVTLLYFIRRRTDLPFNWMFFLFGVFIVACGATHWMEVWTLWNPQYWLAGTIKAITAAASVSTAVLLVALVPKALAIPSTRQLQEARDQLQAEVHERSRAEHELQRAHATLEERVARRTQELKRANAELERQRVQLEDADRRKDEFLAILSHELRNPLHAIATATAFLQREGSPEPRLQGARQTIERQTTKLGHLLDDLLDVSRIASGKMQLALETVDMKSIVLAALETVDKSIEDRKQVFRLDLPQAQCYVKGDAARLEQVVANLLHNASKYTPTGGRISLTVRTTEHQIVLIVADNGIGIEPADLPHLFELFSQGRSAPVHSGGGLGIGLHLARELVRMHGGQVGAVSAGPGRGSEFTVTLPATRPPVPTDVDRNGCRSATIPSLRIVVVDDNRDAAESLAMLLEAEGHMTRVAFDGPTGVDEITSFTPDAALVDIGLPGFDGYEVARRVRATSGGAKLLLVAITGWGQDSDKRAARAAGFDHHITKPLQYDELSVLLAKYAEAKGLASPSAKRQV